MDHGAFHPWGEFHCLLQHSSFYSSCGLNDERRPDHFGSLPPLQSTTATSGTSSQQQQPKVKTLPGSNYLNFLKGGGGRGGGRGGNGGGGPGTTSIMNSIAGGMNNNSISGGVAVSASGRTTTSRRSKRSYFWASRSTRMTHIPEYSPVCAWKTCYGLRIIAHP